MSTPADLINTYFTLAPQADTAPYFAQFAEDVLVEDEGHEYRGVEAVRAWQTTVPSVTYSIRDIVPDKAGHDARVDIEGDFPGSPVMLTFHFQFGDDDRIALLIIRP